VKVGDLVKMCWYDVLDEEDAMATGMVLATAAPDTIPPLMEILWDTGYISLVYADQMGVISESR